ncbi:MAG TPA: hypothetical protein VNX68_07110, partial [Nitrosopumilaceae archaeon]|nr:hypothetical protein [Nitrosopumilaceae archaeon]
MTDNSNEWDQLLKKLNQPVKPQQKTETHLLAITLPEDSWKRLAETGNTSYLAESELVAWSLGAYVERHKHTG